MPLTVVTLTKVPNPLRGDLSKWMQEIADGVYVGNFNSKVRENLWKRICENISNGEATLSYACRNEIGYSFETFNTKREVIDYDGIPLVLIPKDRKEENENSGLGFSDAARFRRIKKYAERLMPGRTKGYVIIDIETTGLNEKKDEIIELGAVKISDNHAESFQRLIKPAKQVPEYIKEMTGITDEMLKASDDLKDVLGEFESFIGKRIIVGYNTGFDLKFINEALRKNGRGALQNESHDLMLECYANNELIDIEVQKVVLTYHKKN